MTPRKNTKKSSNGEDGANLTNKGKSPGNTSPPAAASPNVRRSKRKNLAQTSPSQDACESSSKKSRQSGLSPETPSRVSPRGKREHISPAPSRSSPRRGRRSQKDSPGSGTANVDITSTSCASTPGRGRRTRRESNSSSVSGTSDTTPQTPTTPQRGRRGKRKVPDKVDVELPNEANGSSPQYSPNTKRRRGRRQEEISPTTTNGKSECLPRPRRKIRTPSPSSHDEVLDGAEEEVDEEECGMKNSVDITGAVESEDVKVEENGSVTNTGLEDETCVSGSVNASATSDTTDTNISVKSKDSNDIQESEKCEISAEKHDSESQNVPSGDTEARTCSTSPLPEKQCTDRHTCETVTSSSHVKSSKRRHGDSDSTESETPEHTQSSKKVKQCVSVPDESDRVKCEQAAVESDLIKQEIQEETDHSEPSHKMETEGQISGDVVNVVAEGLFHTFGLTKEQKQEMCLLLTTDTLESKIIEELVETLLNKAISVQTMNAPRFNKFLRQLLNHYCGLDTSKESKHDLCEKAVQWARDRKSVNLRHELELTLMSLYYNTSQYKKAEKIANSLYNETKKLQDKEKTVKACLCLSQVYHAMGNISKARANITTAKTEALKIYTPPDMQGELDLQSGIMQVAEGKDMETAFSYFKEAATGFVSHKQRARALKYMLLSKIMMNRSEEGEKAVRSQSHIQDIDEGVEVMLAIAGAAHKSSLMDFRKLREKHKDHLVGDIVVASILDDLYTSMMEKNLLNIVLPYERIQIGHIAEKIGLPREEVERRISQMILDKRINAQLDHRDDCLYVYAAVDTDVVYQTGIKTLSQLDKTISHLNRKVKKLL